MLPLLPPIAPSRTGEAWPPTKRTDARAKRFKGESVEVDAIPPELLRSLASDAILQHIDAHALLLLRAAEESERELLYAMAAQVTPS
ncbi:MAG: hypothetical protein ACRDZ1_02785 [Acidimicrobiia bacterium]